MFHYLPQDYSIFYSFLFFLLLYSLMSQLGPVHPGRQSHRYPPIRLRQERAWTHILISHSLVSKGRKKKSENTDLVNIQSQLSLKDLNLNKVSLCDVVGYE